MKTNKHIAIIPFNYSIKQLLILLGLACSIQLNAQAPAIEWQQSFGGSQLDLGESTIQTEDGGYILTGYAYSNNGNVTGNHGLSDGWVVKLNSVGTLQWQKALGGPGIDYFNDIKQTSDGGYITTGYSNANGGDVTGNHGGADTWVVKLNPSGNLQWQKSLGGSLTDIGNCILQTSDGGYIISGSSQSSNGDVSGNNGGNDFWIVKINNVGTIAWERSYGGSDSDSAYCIIETTEVLF